MQEIDMIGGYHAHIYFDSEAERAKAAELREAIAQCFADLDIGDWVDAPRGPHPAPMFMVSFEPDRYAEFVPWLSLNRDGLDILIHPRTGDEPQDHSDHALWMGQARPINLKGFTGRFSGQFGIK